MAKAHVHDTFNAPADAVWSFFRDFGGVQKFAGPMVTSCTLEGEGIGSVRTIALAQGAPIRERLVQFDEEAKSFSYAILGSCDLPIDDYVGTVKIKAAGPSRSTIDWIGTFDPKGAPEAAAKEIVEGIYKGGIDAIKTALGK